MSLYLVVASFHCSSKKPASAIPPGARAYLNDLPEATRKELDANLKSFQEAVSGLAAWQ